jgi:hypothetical protein
MAANPTDPRNLLTQFNTVVNNSRRGLTLSPNELRLLRDFIVALYGEIEPSVEEWDALCEKVADKEARRRDPEARALETT